MTGKGNTDPKSALWNDRMGAALMQTVPRSLIFTVTGDCDYDRIVELCFTVGKRSNQLYERIVIDFRWLEKVEGETWRFMVNQLSQLAAGRKILIYLVHVPGKAQSLFRRVPGADLIRFTRTLEEAILA
jgi:hypothetical protein